MKIMIPILMVTLAAPIGLIGVAQADTIDSQVVEVNGPGLVGPVKMRLRDRGEAVDETFFSDVPPRGTVGAGIYRMR